MEKKMKKTLSALVAVALLSFGVAFAQEATTTTHTGPKTKTNPITGATTEKASTTSTTTTPHKTTHKKTTHKKVTKKSGAVKSETTKTEATTAAMPAPTPMPPATK
jgi:Ni/Co efflux regulator RcnB